MSPENQNVPEKTEPKKSGIRTMVSDVQEYASGKKFSLGELVANKGRRTEDEDESVIEKIKPWAYVISAVLILILAGFGAFWIKQAFEPSDKAVITAPAPLVTAGKEYLLELKSSGDKEALFKEWQKLADSQLLPREFLYIKTLDQEQNKYLDWLEMLAVLESFPPPLLSDSFGQRSTVGFMDTSRGNEAIFIIEVKSYSQAFAGLLRWEEKMADDLKDLLIPGLSYDRGEEAFTDLVVANNDARFLRNRLGEFILGYSIFNRRFLIIAQSPQAIEAAIRQMSALPPR